MALVCPACGTENRSAARYCIDCIAPLPTDFTPTMVTAPGANAGPAGYEGLPSVLAAFVASRPGAAGGPGATHTAHAPAPAPAVAPPPAAARGRGLWVSVAAFAIAMVIGAGGWLIAGAGGWYIYSSTASGAEPAGAPVASVAAPMPMPVPVPVPVPVPRPVAPEPVGAAPVSATPQQGRTAPPKRAASPPAHLSAPAAARGEARKSDTAGAPSQQCGELNFIARARCMAAQCALPRFGRHAECDAVRRQRRLMEQKRNPGLAD